jgi:hypothetical protein
MSLILYILFAASLLGLATMIGVRIAQIRNGMAFEHRPENRHLPEIDLARARTTATLYGKRYGHLLVLLALKLWIKLTYFLKRKAKELEPAMKKMLSKKNAAQGAATVSAFLNSVSEYKKKVQKAHQHMKREEEKKDEEDTGTL